ncbi:MAG: radical SAM protein [Nitrospira sp.]|nr:MAG: radical SAM protein [Nitrospira sp.]
MAGPLTVLSHVLKPFRNLVASRPVLATFQVNLRCNSACGYCDLPLNVGRYEMTREEIQLVFSGLYREGVRFVLVQGGEPLLRRDVCEILEDLSAMGLHLTLITNGTKLTTQIIERLGRIPLAISVSLDTLNREIYQRIRGADQLEQVLEGIGLLRGFPHPKFLTCIVSEANRTEVQAVVRFARAQGFLPVVGAYHWNVGTYGRRDELLMYERSSAAAVFRGLLDDELIPPGYFRKFVEDNASWLRGEKLEPCDAGRYSVAIDASGNVSPCLAFPFAGNLLESSLSEILERFDRGAIKICSDNSSCNRLDGRVVGTILRHPMTAWRTSASVL